jgi:amidophosphoribosyltransferase
MCGIFGIFGHDDAARLTVYGLYGLQHRGQESAGVVTSDGECLRAAAGMGLVADVFGHRDLGDLKGNAAIGHVRYSTSGDSLLQNAQPIVAATQHGEVALGHNGNLVNAAELRAEYEGGGAIFRSTTDSEVILHGFAKAPQPSPLDALVDSLGRVRGAFSLVVLTRHSLIGVRDPRGFRPLVLGDRDGTPVLASETCALDLIRAKYIREIKPGEVVEITRDGTRSIFPFLPAPFAGCIFEYVYFARPDTRLFGQTVLDVRKALGRRLAEEQPAPADMVVPVPDSGIGAAMGYAERSGLPVEWGLIRNHYVGRTFIAPTQRLRDLSARIKLNPVPDVLRGKRVVLVDDSLVRGTTSRNLVRIVREAGASEVHLRLSSPPTVGPCRYGIDTPERSELLAANKDLEGVRAHVGADSVGYLSVEGLYASVGASLGTYCHACFGGPYPVEWAKVRAEQSRLFEKEQR